ncbi:MAG: peptidylprolyl isomerase, partial [Gemmatimonadales bacterium]
VSFLGQVGGPDAVAELTALLKGKASFAERREALLGLAHADSGAFLVQQRKWSESADWRERAAAGEAWEQVSPGPRRGKPDFLEDPDGRVVGAALQAWSAAVEGPSPPLVAAARKLISHQDAAVRSIAADALARAADPADAVALAGMYRRTASDSFPDAALSALAALAAIATASDPGLERVTREFLSLVPRPADYLQRRWAEEHWPDLAERWGPAYPIATGRSLEDYRDVVRRILLPKGADHSAHVVVETSQLDPVQLELFGGDAPMTVANFLLLVDRRFFDRHRWHRVVPNFVVQDGDPRGDGWGGPGGVIRDEINPRRYDAGVVGMALSGSDTGSSQWFITLSPQPHLDGTYTVFGRVKGNTVTLNRIVQGDLIKAIHR